jgi:hypothetical protein
VKIKSKIKFEIKPKLLNSSLGGDLIEYIIFCNKSSTGVEFIGE